MLNRSKAEAEAYIRENSKSFVGKYGKTDKELGRILGVSGPRVCQMRGEMKGPATIPESVETALAPEAA